MKKLSLLFASMAVMIAVFAACTTAESGPTGSASEIVDKIFEQSGDESFGMTLPLDDENALQYYLGSTDYPEFADVAVVAPLINIDTRLMVVIKAKDKGDVAAILADLEKNINPDRLICVSFSLDDVVIDSRGDVVFMTINSDADQRASLEESFASII